MIPVKSTTNTITVSKSIIAEGIHALYGYSMREVAGAEGTVKLRDGGALGKVIACEQLAAKASPKIFWPDGVEILKNALYFEVVGEVEYVIYYL
jgi:hypothetical protein